MKVGFKAKAGKNKAKKATKLKKKAMLASKGADVDMSEAAPAAQEVDMSEAAPAVEAEAGQGGRSAHQAKVQLKRALKVKVAAFKTSRNKITRLPGNKQVRRQLSDNIKEAVEAQRTLGAKPATAKRLKGKAAKGKKTGAGKAAAAAPVATMDT